MRRQRVRQIAATVASVVAVGLWSSAVAAASQADSGPAPASATAVVKPAGIAAVQMPGGFVAVTPIRLVDTRASIGALGPVNMHRSIDVSVSPQGVGPLGPGGAVVVNVTVTHTAGSGYLTAYPAHTTRPTVSNLNFTKGQTVANLATVAVQDGKITIYNGSGASVDIVVDLFGYYLPGTVTDPGAFTPLSPARVLDTRSGLGATKGQLKGAHTLALKVGGQAGVPTSGVSAVVLNLTATNVHATGYVTAYPDGTTRPATSNLNVTAGTTVPNMVTAQVSSAGRLDLYNGSSQPIDLVADVAGYFLAGTATQAGAYVPIQPTRFLDTRLPRGVKSGPLSAHTFASVQVQYIGGSGPTHVGGIPASNVSAVVTNLTATSEASSGYLSVFPLQSNPSLGTSNLNFAKATTRANAAVVKVGTCGQLSFYNGSGAASQVIGDASGYYLANDAPTGPAPDSTVESWGDGSAGVLGTGSFGSTTAPTPTLESGSIVSIAANQHALAIDADGLVSAWGLDSSGALGVGEQTATDQGFGGCAIPVPSVGGAVAVAVGATSSYVLDVDGSVWAWGGNTTGQLGDGTTTPELSWAKVPGLSDVTAIAAGPSFVLVLKTDGTVWGWGRETAGELGTGASTILTPTQIAPTTLTGITAIAAGGHNGYALTSDGHVLAWGADNTGELGDGGPVDLAAHPTPTTVAGLTNVGKVVAGPGQTAYAVLADGTVASWGANDKNQLGDGIGSSMQAARSTPGPVSGLTEVSTVAAGPGGAMALEADGTAWVWGTQPAYGTTTDPSTPRAVAGLTGVTAIAEGANSAFAVVP